MSVKRVAVIGASTIGDASPASNGEAAPTGTATARIHQLRKIT
jgi:hypothetical protein